MTIEAIKSQLLLLEVLAHYNLTPDRNGRLCCPFHDDSTPSLQIYPATNTAYCFSTNCRTHGHSMDVIDFIMHKEGCSKHEAILKAKGMLDPDQAASSSVAKNIISGEAVTSQPTPMDNSARIAFLEQMFAYFKRGAGSSAAVVQYMNMRRINVEKVEVGYNSGQFHHGSRKSEELIEQCLQYGLLSRRKAKSRTGGQSYGVFGKGCVVFALRNRSGQVAGMYFRSTSSVKDQRHFYLKNRQGLYPCYPGAKTRQLILCESIIDAATLLQIPALMDRYTVLALYGTNGLTAEHQQAISELAELQEIIFAFDGDEAGQKATDKYAQLLRTDYPNLRLSQLPLPPGEDINSLAVRGPQVYWDLLQNRELLFSVEKPTERKSEVVTSVAGAAPTPESAPQTGLDTSQLHNIKYRGQAAFYQIKGFKPEQLDSLKVSLQLIAASGADHRAKLDLYEYKQVRSVAVAAADRLGLRSDLVEGDLSVLTNLLESWRDEQQQGSRSTSPKVQVPPTTATACLEFLRRPKLMQRFNELIGQAGIVGEDNNRLLLFTIASSYAMPDTLHALIQGSSGSGKTRLLRTISELMPPEDAKRYTRVTDNSFYNQDEHFFVHKLVCFEDLDGLKEDAQLAVRELQSNEILITSTSIKDANGSIRGGERIVRGPIASLACTTNGEVYEDNISRCFVVAVDETEAQTLRIIDYQNRLAAGLVDKTEQTKTTEFIRNCMRLLKPYEVINPYANQIKLPQGAHKIRRLNELYQSFVRQITLLNQYQRKTDKQGRLITQKEDLQAACDILFESIILKVDELNGSLRQFFERLKNYVKAEAREFTQREIRQELQVSKSQLQRYLQSLLEYGYVYQSGGYINRGLRYRIDYWDNHHKTRTELQDYLGRQLEKL